MFPVQATQNNSDSSGLFYCDDPDLKVKILPLFRFNKNSAEGHPIGHGTAFRIDPWSRCATAFHVIEDFLEEEDFVRGSTLKNDYGLAALELNGFGCGVFRLPDNAWRQITGAFTFVREEKRPLNTPRRSNFSELAVLRIRPTVRTSEGCPYLPIDISSWAPRIGEEVMALGYANLGGDGQQEDDTYRIQADLYGSRGEIIDIEHPDLGRKRSWPQIRVAADWPGGMSGGPVFNSAGNVIGVVSASLVGQGVSTATIFRGWDVASRCMGSIDPHNTGYFICYGAFNHAGELVRCGQDRKQIEIFAKTHNLSDFGFVSFNPITKNYIRH